MYRRLGYALFLTACLCVVFGEKRELLLNTTESWISTPSSTAAAQVETGQEGADKSSFPECGLSLPGNSMIWRENKSVELVLPSSIPSICSTATNCSTNTTLHANVTLQSTDVLIIVFSNVTFSQQMASVSHRSNVSDDNDTITGDVSDTTENYSLENVTVESPAPTPSPKTVSLYHVTSEAFDYCDIKHGVEIVLNIRELNGKRMVILSEEILAEGINYFIGKAPAWGTECLKIQAMVKAADCGDEPHCFGKGVCYTNATMDSYECHCCPGYVGAQCEERDACFYNPCKNSGICVDISQGHERKTFQCLCPYGYRGTTCEQVSNPCDSSPCKNGGGCIGNETHFRCVCRAGFTGPLCEHNIDECASSPCVHGICVDQEYGYRCFCQPGFGGGRCEYEYNECESSPCINGGTCMDHIGRYQCLCSRGYTGSRCHIKVVLCVPNPCPKHRHCMDRGNNYTCECPPGFAGTDCDIRHQACSPNPCLNGGTCWNSVDSFFCACRPGFTGKTCEDQFVLETIPTLSTIQNGLDLQMPISIQLDHLHNVYIAAGTLACAVLIVVITVAVCHCRVNETYKRCSFKMPRFCISLSECGKHLQQNAAAVLPTTTKKEKPWGYAMEVEAEATSSASNLPNTCPPLDTADLYYTLDFSDNQNSPLIN